MAIDIHSVKYDRMHMDLAEVVGKYSYAQRKQVGCVVVTTTGVIGYGLNGAIPGMPNVCEGTDGTTLDTVIHAERNALNKLAREGISPLGSKVFVTLSPCVECAKSLHAVGVDTVVYKIEYKCTKGIELLKQLGVKVYKLGWESK